MTIVEATDLSSFTTPAGKKSFTTPAGKNDLEHPLQLVTEKNTNILGTDGRVVRQDALTVGEVNGRKECHFSAHLILAKARVTPLDTKK